jgi:hypothetical protein
MTWELDNVYKGKGRGVSYLPIGNNFQICRVLHGDMNVMIGNTSI